ncbi:winged helix-turn-helix domain-containing protein [Halovivax gelatinilyticus]|uniref:winged helix-turn-helix domain-containing protein n=1 Tax=Halovivax gelatinilyticus TaxID=2961597 RepID=UPI0020CA3949|nr:winged helix-turn-helix domain-containing protein [Halovivax gelatinilyticus]
MSSEFSQTGRTSDRTVEVSDNPAKQLDVLGNECSRTILVATQEGPRTAKELTERTDSSSATVYRRINDLLASDLIEECIRFDAGGSHTTAYRATVEELSISFDTDGIAVSIARTTQ